MASEAKITIIIPVFNRGEVVKSTLYSIEKQSLRPLNVILVDNNSTDNTLEVLNDWKMKVETNDFHITILSESKPGAAAARNRGLKEVKTPYTMFFDSDDIMLPTHAERIVNFLSKNPDVDVVGYDVDVKTLSGAKTQYRFCDRDILYNHIFHATFATQRYAARTSLFKEVGEWNESLPAWNDYELGVRILLANPKVKRLGGDATVLVVLMEDSITGTKFSSKPQHWEIALDAIDNAFNNSNHSNMTKYIDVRRAILAGFYKREGAINDAHRLLGEVMSRSGWYRKIVMRLFFNIISRGGRGIALLARPLLCFTK
ncbi:MAG: glycosyltransferase family 2 protein [Muribaculaceae bacterium]|nr:glycosyltransferase family 2 protein [Muribaculaceae bacterium]